MSLNDKVLMRLKNLKDRLWQIENDLALEEVLADQHLTVRLEKERKQISPIAQKFDELLLENQTFELMKQQNLPENELCAQTCKIHSLQNQILDMLVDFDKGMQNATIKMVNLCESSDKLFELIKNAYQDFFAKENISFKTSNLKLSKKLAREITIEVTGENVFDLLCGENGIHKCSRQGVQVIVYPTPDTPLAKFEENDLKIDIYRSNGAGGQNVNKVSTAVRITHLPTGIIATCQDERSQFQNRERALQNLKEKVAKKLMSDFEAKQKSELKKYTTKNVVRYYDFDKNLITDVKTRTELVADNFDVGMLLKTNLIRS